MLRTRAEDRSLELATEEALPARPVCMTVRLTAAQYAWFTRERARRGVPWQELAIAALQQAYPQAFDELAGEQ